MDIRSEIESWFPNIVGKDFKIFKSTNEFNCVAYSLDFYGDWIWTNEKTWPSDKIPRNSGLNGFKELYKLNGYIDCDNEYFEEGFDKIAFYSKDDIPIHACKQFEYTWRSKLGVSVIIEHELDWLCGYTDWAYGEVSFIMKRKIQ
jgi:hypothetical protein